MNKEEPFEGGTELTINVAIYRQIFITIGNLKCLNFTLRRKTNYIYFRNIAKEMYIVIN